jgi:hypothetical protein
MVDPYDQAAINHTLQQLLSDSALRQNLIQRGQQQTKHFAWANSAAKLQEIYRVLLT